MSRWLMVVALVAVVMCGTFGPARADLVVGSPAPVPGTLELAGVACANATDCVAVGATASFSGGVVMPITAGVPGSAQVVSNVMSLESVACVSASTCVAVGENHADTAAVVVPITDGVPGKRQTVSGTENLVVRRAAPRRQRGAPSSPRDHPGDRARRSAAHRRA